MKKRGFTLIELLVVISIISLLSSIILSSLNTARAKARDARRLQDLGQIRIALELYRLEEGHYPWPNDLNEPDAFSNNLFGWNNSSNPDSLGVLLGEYINIQSDPINLPENPTADPSNSAQSNVYGYVYDANTIDLDGEDAYFLLTRLESNHPLSCEVKEYKTPLGREVCGTIPGPFNLGLHPQVYIIFGGDYF